MASDGAVDYPAIMPMIAYEDPAAALEWLARAFGFRERTRMSEPGGRITHAEMDLGDGVIMLANPSPQYRGPRRHAQECDQARAWLDNPFVVDGLHVFVDDVDEHARRAKEAGARILREPADQDYGERVYVSEDLEGHRWMFAHRI
jgi:PhnB protein